ncbi:MAG: tetratricopeptide repeat protein [Myxococcota bacterium]|jgi:tetratricopeptide (TPR) repeat protein|nr:tetratricopeptide repeat protein [Myxococcota bacterium]
MRRRILFFASLLLALPWTVQADPAANLAGAEKAYAGRKDPASLQQAIALWQKVLEEDPSNAEAAWKLSRAAVWWGDHAPKGKREEIHKKGMNWGKQAIKLDPQNPEAHYWTAANMGSYGRAHGIMESLSMIKPMKAECETILRLDKNYWRAHMLLGMLYREAPGWPVSIGDDGKAVEELKRAVALAPRIPRALFELGLGYLENGDEELARKTLQQAIDAPPEPGFELESLETQAKARAKIKEMD